MDWQEARKFDCRLVRTIFIFVVLGQFSQVVGLVGEWLENQILIPDWTYFHCQNSIFLNIPCIFLGSSGIILLLENKDPLYACKVLLHGNASPLF